MVYDFERKINNNKHIPVASGLYSKSDYLNILEGKYVYNCGEDVKFLFVGRVDKYNKQYKIYLK